MQSCKLKLRTEKKKERKKMIIVDLSVRVSLAGCESADIGGSSIPFQSTVAYFGVNVTHALSVKQHIRSLSCTTFRAVWRITSIPFVPV